MELRPYQQAAVDAVYQFLREKDGNPCVVIPTAGGKTPTIATICRDAVCRWSGRVLILAHVKELLQQAADKLGKVCPDVPVGIYSAGLGSRETQAPVVVAGIQSAFRRAREFGHFDLILIDECHLLQPEGDGMYRSLLMNLKEINPQLRIIGFTATPFRLSSGPICGPDNLLNEICYEVSVAELIAQKYLCPLISKAARNESDTSNLSVRAGEFVASEVETLMDNQDKVKAACTEILEYTRERNSVLIFASSIQHGYRVEKTLRELGQDVESVYGETSQTDRDQILQNFKDRKLKYLVNVGVLTTGFDAPGIDCVVLLRPTMSSGLYYQMLGRGFRLDPSKKNCLVLDFAGNVMRHGPVDALNINIQDQEEDGQSKSKAKPGIKICPKCRLILPMGLPVCPECQFQFPLEEIKHEAEASTKDVLKGAASIDRYPVFGVRYFIHNKKGAGPDAPQTMRVEYKIGIGHYVYEWICFEHSGFARAKAVKWWERRSGEPVPDTSELAVIIADTGGILAPTHISVKSGSGKKYDEIVGYEFEISSDPQPVPEPEYANAESEIPF